MPRVTFIHPDGKSGEVEKNLTLLEASEVLGFSLNHDCGGSASCSSCRVEVMFGGETLSDIDFDEQDLLDREGLRDPHHRLACQSRILGDVVVHVPEEKWGEPMSQVQGQVSEVSEC